MHIYDIIRHLDTLLSNINWIFLSYLGPVYLDKVRCVGNEESITECTFLGFGNFNCLHRHNAAVHCNSKFNTFFFEMFTLKFNFLLLLILNKIVGE